MGCCGPQSVERPRSVRSVACACSAYAAAGSRSSPACECISIIRRRGRVRSAAAVVIERYGSEVGVGVRRRGRKRYCVLMDCLCERRVQIICAAVRCGQIRYALAVGVFSCQVVV